MKTDRELLELAAKAVGIELHRWMGDLQNRYLLSPDYESGLAVTWNPLTNDGDALRLAVKLHLNILFASSEVGSHTTLGYSQCELYTDHQDQESATRRAIVRAAAAIGEAMK